MGKSRLEIFRIDISGKLALPFADESILAEFPSPVQGYMYQLT